MAFGSAHLRDRIQVRVFLAQRLSIGRDWDSADVRSSYWRLYVMNRDGASVLLDGGRRYALPGGRVHLIPAWVKFTCRCLRRLEHLYVHFDLIGLPPRLVRELFDSPVTLPRRAALLQQAAGLADDAPANGFAELLRIKALIYAALGDMVEELPPEKAQRCAQQFHEQQVVQPALLHIEANPHLPLGNDELAQLCNLSTDHFIRRFREAVGQTPGHYVMERRVARAAEELSFTDQTIDAIAHACGFANRYYFSRVFARVMGLPPAAYRSSSRF